jgi:hypothetical protein
MTHYLYHVHVQNDMEIAIGGLNLRYIWSDIEPGQSDVITLEAGESVEFYCSDPRRRLFHKLFNESVVAAGGTVGEVWWAYVGSLPSEE